MYGGKVGPSVLTGGTVIAGTQFPAGPYLLMGLGLLLAGLIAARVLYRRHRQAASQGQS